MASSNTPTGHLLEKVFQSIRELKILFVANSWPHDELRLPCQLLKHASKYLFSICPLRHGKRATSKAWEVSKENTNIDFHVRHLRKLIRTEKSHTFGSCLTFLWILCVTKTKIFRTLFSSDLLPFGILSCSAQAVFPRSSLLFQQLLLSVSFLLLFSLCLSRLREGKRRIMLFGWSFYFFI